jgi:preprotein translocase subunit SecD
MMIRWDRFNIYLPVLLAAVMLCGCQTAQSKSKNKPAALRLHIETNPDSTGFTTSVPIYRASPMNVNIHRSPFLTEVQVAEARVIDVVGGFAIQVKFDRRGTWFLEEYSNANPGKRVAIFCQFADSGGKGDEARWLGAPRFERRISDGVLTFTPDATREEASQIVLGLNNAAKKHQDKELKW